MNPSNLDCQSSQPSLSHTSAENHEGTILPINRSTTGGCFSCLHRVVLKICEGWFISLGVVAILFIMIGFFKFSNEKHGESLIFTGVGFLVILSTFMLSQRQRQNGPRQIIRRPNDSIFIITVPSSGSSNLIGAHQPPIFPSLMVPSESSTPPCSRSNSHHNPKPSNDAPPPYEDVATLPLRTRVYILMM